MLWSPLVRIRVPRPRINSPRTPSCAMTALAALTVGWDAKNVLLKDHERKELCKLTVRDLRFIDLNVCKSTSRLDRGVIEEKLNVPVYTSSPLVKNSTRYPK